MHPQFIFFASTAFSEVSALSLREFLFSAFQLCTDFLVSCSRIFISDPTGFAQPLLSFCRKPGFAGSCALHESSVEVFLRMAFRSVSSCKWRLRPAAWPLRSRMWRAPSLGNHGIEASLAASLFLCFCHLGRLFFLCSARMDITIGSWRSYPFRLHSLQTSPSTHAALAKTWDHV